MNADFLTISQVRRRFDITARALRFYEDKGLISPQRDGQHRLYSRVDIRRLSLILRAKRYGLTLNAIGDILDRPVNSETANLIYSTFERQLGHLEQEYDQLGASIIALKSELMGGRVQFSCFDKTAA